MLGEVSECDARLLPRPHRYEKRIGRPGIGLLEDFRNIVAESLAETSGPAVLRQGHAIIPPACKMPQNFGSPGHSEHHPASTRGKGAYDRGGS